MKNRSELFFIFFNFVTEIQTQFGCTIHILYSDNALEYFSFPFFILMIQKGIIYQSSCPDTP